jgi:hypothetical protein
MCMNADELVVICGGAACDAIVAVSAHHVWVGEGSAACGVKIHRHGCIGGSQQTGVCSLALEYS